MRVSVVTITCRKCGRVLSQTIPRATDDGEIETEQPCSPAFAQTQCAQHPAPPPDTNYSDLLGQNMSYSDPPLIWTVKIIELPKRATT